MDHGGDKTEIEIKAPECKEVQTQKSGFAENLKRVVCCIDRRRQS